MKGIDRSCYEGYAAFKAEELKELQMECAVEYQRKFYVLAYCR